MGILRSSEVDEIERIFNETDTRTREAYARMVENDPSLAGVGEGMLEPVIKWHAEIVAKLRKEV
jgi:hypothetical protein